MYIQLLGKIDINTLKQITTEERMIKFHIQEYERCGKVIMPICSRLAGRQIDQTFGIMDVKGERRCACWGLGGAGTEVCAVRRSACQAAVCEQRCAWHSSSNGTAHVGHSMHVCMTAAVYMVTHKG